MSESKKNNIVPKELWVFVNKLFLPASEEIGLILSDQLKSLRQRNQIRILEKTHKILNADTTIKPISSLSLAYRFWEKASLEEDDFVQSRWASMLASAATTEDSDEKTQMCIRLLGQMTPGECKTFDDLVRSIEGYHETSRTYWKKITFSTENQDALHITSLVNLGIIESEPVRDFQAISALAEKGDDEPSFHAYAPDERRYFPHDKYYIFTELGSLFAENIYSWKERYDMNPESSQ